MTSQKEIESLLLEFLRQGVFSSQITVTEETDLVANGFDSLSLVSLLQFIEKKFGLWIPESDINEETLKNVRCLAALIFRLLHERPPSP
jgi:acyl carrier protein